VNTFVLGAARAEGQPDESLRQRQRREIIRYIEQHLTDPALSIGQIADLHRISKRYLHWLFREEAMTVNEFIISRRLQGCRKELINPDAAHRHVSQIAYAWGFANLSHFSKRYRAQFQESPTETRRTAVCV
jgi:AraC-like DNA-binding protein